MPALLSDGSRHYNQMRRIHPRDSVSQLGYYLNNSSSTSTSSPSSSELSSTAIRHRDDERSRRRHHRQCQQGVEESELGTTHNRDDERKRNYSDSSSFNSGSTFRQILMRRRKNGGSNSSSKQARQVSDSVGKHLVDQHETSWLTPDRFKRYRRNIRHQGQQLKDNNTSNTSECGSYIDDGLNLNSADSPVTNSSGFGEGTLVGYTIAEYFERPDHQVSLNDQNLRGVLKGGVAGGERDHPDIHHHYIKTIGDTMIQYGRAGQVLGSGRSAGIDNRGGDSRLAEVLRVNSSLLQGRSDLARLKRRNINRLNRRMLIGDGDHLVNSYALSELFSQSEIPGFREIFASDSYLRKFCWVVAFLFMTVLSLNDMTELITEYYEYPITVDVRLKDSARLPFPSVTVCNLNVVRFSALCSSTSSTTTNFDLVNQIPSELRDKLCGIQVEKKKNDTDSDINDINNIGITTTTTTPVSTVVTSGGGDNNSSGPFSSSTTPSSNGGGGGSTNQASSSLPDSNGSNNDNGHYTKISQGGGDFTDSYDEHKAPGKSPATLTSTTIPQQQVTQQLSSTTRRTTANGGLDLGDFAMLVMDPKATTAQSILGEGRIHQRERKQGAPRSARSIRLNENDPEDPNPRPFVSSKSRMRIRVPPQSTDNPDLSSRQSNIVTSDNRQRVSQYIDRRTSGSSSVSQQTNRIHNVQNNPGQQPSLGNRNVPVNPGSIAINAFQNPLLNNLATAQTTSPPTPPSTTTFFVPPNLPDEFELTERQERELQENLTNWLAVMYNRDPQLTWSLGHQFDDMILRCTMKSINCTHQRSFENSFTPTEGNCFTYRPKIKRRLSSRSSSTSSSSSSTHSYSKPGSSSSPSSVFEEANLAGTNHGLELVLNLEKNEYISGSSQVGALVMIHHPNDLGYAASEATFVAPEFTTYIGLKMVNITRLPAPYPEYCIDSWPAKFADTLTRNSTYSQQACLKICLQKTIQSHCQCQSAFLPVVELDNPQPDPIVTITTTTTSTRTSGFASSSSTLTEASDSTEAKSTTSQQSDQQKPEHQQQRIIICDTRKLATRQCVREVMFRAADRVHNCECPPKCQVIRYDKTISMARWPTREDKVTFDRGKMDVNFQNLAKVIVYFQTMTCEEVTQQAVFNAAKLFSALGGIMGMYVGFSFLSVFEIFEVMSRKMWHHFTVKISNTTSRIVNNLRN